MSTPEAKDTSPRRFTRREAIGLLVGGTIGLIEVACGGERGTPIAVEKTPTTIPSPTREIPTPTKILTPTKKPTPTEAPTETPTKTPTPEPSPTPEIQRVIYLEDNFSGTNRIVFEGPNPHFENDALFFTFAEDGGWLWAARHFPLSNFRLEARLAGDGDYGLNFGGIPWEGKINYDLVLEKNGHLLLNWYKGDVFQGGLFDVRVVSPSQREGFHTFGLDYDGKKLILFFDGEKVGEVSKTSLRGGLEEAGGNGQIGLFCWDDGKENVEVGIDYLAVKLPQELIPTPTPVPPEPTETPRPPVCEIPHFTGRTPDRKTGYIIDFGEYYPEIYHPDSSPYAPYDNGARGMRMDIPGTSYDAWKWVREAVVVNIDKENQIIELYVGRGLTVKRRFTQDTHVVMSAHEVYRGMPSSQARQWGGNFCDLEVGDIVGLIHPDFGEAVNLNPGLVDLWGGSYCSIGACSRKIFRIRDSI